MRHFTNFIVFGMNRVIVVSVHLDERVILSTVINIQYLIIIPSFLQKLYDVKISFGSFSFYYIIKKLKLNFKLEERTYHPFNCEGFLYTLYFL